MNRKPSRTFVYLALIMVFLLVIGLVVVGVLASSNQSPSSFELTRDSIAGTNAAYAKTEAGTAIDLEATLTRVVMSNTPLPYTADMSPTALPRFTGTPTPIFYTYDSELSQQRQTEVWLLMTSGGPTQYAIFYATETALVEAYQTAQYLNQVPSLTPLPTVTGSGVVQCAYAWAHRDLPDVATLAQAALAKANITNITIRADAYGEDCIASNTVVSFGAMTTDFYLTVEVSNLNGQNTLADYVKDVYAVLSDFDQDRLPARLGYLDITFMSDGQTKRLRTTFDEAKAALDKKLSGAALLEALGGLR